MVTVEILSWIALGIAIGIISYYASATKNLSLGEVTLVGAIGGFLSGLVSLWSVPAKGFNGFALTMAGVGSIVFLLVDWSIRGGRRHEPHPPTP